MWFFMEFSCSPFVCMCFSMCSSSLPNTQIWLKDYFELTLGLTVNVALWWTQTVQVIHPLQAHWLWFAPPPRQPWKEKAVEKMNGQMTLSFDSIQLSVPIECQLSTVNPGFYTCILPRPLYHPWCCSVWRNMLHSTLLPLLYFSRESPITFYPSPLLIRSSPPPTSHSMCCPSVFFYCHRNIINLGSSLHQHNLHKKPSRNLSLKKNMNNKYLSFSSRFDYWTVFLWENYEVK